jgi:DNA-binding response OmpR family regulator
MLPLRLEDDLARPAAAARRAVPLVVVADDDEDILAMVVFRLERSGFDVATARDGAEALELVTRLQPDLAVLDVAMPKLTGIEVTERLRADGAAPGTTILLLTARASESDVQRGLAAGADAYVTKPFSPQDLAARVEALLA